MPPRGDLLGSLCDAGSNMLKRSVRFGGSLFSVGSGGKVLLSFDDDDVSTFRSTMASFSLLVFSFSFGLDLLVAVDEGFFSTGCFVVVVAGFFLVGVFVDFFFDDFFTSSSSLSSSFKGYFYIIIRFSQNSKKRIKIKD